MTDLEVLSLLSQFSLQSNINSVSTISGRITITDVGVLVSSSARATNGDRDSSRSRRIFVAGATVGATTASATTFTDRASTSDDPQQGQ
jgi:hypothetical protein